MKIEKDSVQETLVIPLYSRKLCARYYPDIFEDESAARLLENIEYDFSEMEKKSLGAIQKFGALEVAIRQFDIAEEVREYLREHPEAAVVNMGCGLDQTGELCDNGSCHIFNLDMEDVISVRNELIPPGERVRNIAADLNDTEWFDNIDASNGAVFFASGVFYYFRREQVKNLLRKMSFRFPGGKLVFDSAGKTTVRLMINSWIKMSGINNADAYFYIDDMKKDIALWLPNAKVTSREYMRGYHSLKSPSVGRVSRIMARICDRVMKMRIVRIDF